MLRFISSPGYSGFPGLWILGALAMTACGQGNRPSPSEAAYEALTNDYVEAYKAFYPTRANRMGLGQYEMATEDRSPAAIEEWVRFNTTVQDSLLSAPADLSIDLRIDLRLLKNRVRAELADWGEGAQEEAFSETMRKVAEGDFRLGRDRFAEELRLYYDMEITPEEVTERALAEIHTVRSLIAVVSNEHWAEAHAGEPIPEDMTELMARVSADMEENRPSTQEESLVAFTRFADEAEAFVRDQGIATLPADRTLEIVLTPESAGPSARIGFVNSAPPFDPDPVTTLSLPTIPDDYSEEEKEDFYRSFNNHFNKMIIIHELFPGHYMQMKIASGNPRVVRIFFPYQPYVEGWTTLVETLALDAGWDDFNKLTYLSHLRKRLENANRAYTSVQVHCFGWEEEEVNRFSREEALLAPQFAASLWGRLTRSPMQMTSYFMGKDMFMEVMEGERERLGDAFVVREFTDAILHAGAVPMDMIPELLKKEG